MTPRQPLTDWAASLVAELDHGQRVPTPGEPERVRYVPRWEQERDDAPLEGIET